jgi:hypothetical protein
MNTGNAIAAQLATICKQGSKVREGAGDGKREEMNKETY